MKYPVLSQKFRSRLFSLWYISPIVPSMSVQLFSDLAMPGYAIQLDRNLLIDSPALYCDFLTRSDPRLRVHVIRVTVNKIQDPRSTREQSITHSLQIRASTKCSIKHLTCLFFFFFFVDTTYCNATLAVRVLHIQQYRTPIIFIIRNVNTDPGRVSFSFGRAFVLH